MTALRAIFLTVFAARVLVVAGLLPAGEPPAGAGRPVAEEGPTNDQFYLKVESLIDNVADLDVRRFTIAAATGKPVKFRIGEVAVRSFGHQVAGDQGNVRRLEAIVILRLQGEPHDAKIRRLIKFHRTKGSAVENELEASGLESLAGVVDLKVKSGRYPVGKDLVIGTLNGENIVVTAE